MSFGGMLTGGDEETPSLDSNPTKIGSQTEIIQEENTDKTDEEVSLTVSDISTLTK